LQQVFHPRRGKRHLAHERKSVPRDGATMSNVWQAVLAVIAILDRTRAGEGKSSRA
jgi:hypothetical protein